MNSSQKKCIKLEPSRRYLTMMMSWDTMIMEDPSIFETHSRNPDPFTGEEYIVNAFHRHLELKLFEAVDSSGFFYDILIDIITSYLTDKDCGCWWGRSTPLPLLLEGFEFLDNTKLSTIDEIRSTPRYCEPDTTDYTDYDYRAEMLADYDTEEYNSDDN